MFAFKPCRQCYVGSAVISGPFGVILGPFSVRGGRCLSCDAKELFQSTETRAYADRKSTHSLV